MTMVRYSLSALLVTAAIPAMTEAFVGRPHVVSAPQSHHHSSSVSYRTTSDDAEIDTSSSSASTSPTSTSTATDSRTSVHSFGAMESISVWEDISSNGHSSENNNGKNSRQGNPQQQLPQPVPQVAIRLEEEKDPALVEFVPSEDFKSVSAPGFQMDEIMMDDNHYPFAAMLQGSAPYIASHLGETIVFYIPGEWLHKPNKLFDSFLQDVALARAMGMKMVLVADCRMEVDDQCLEEGYEYAHECHNALKPTPSHTVRRIEEEAGFVRFEVERKMNRFLKTQLVSSGNEEGNVLGGNFYMARSFGTVQGKDFEHTGFVQKVYTDNIEQALARNDIVLLTTVGAGKNGDSVNVNGHHLAATVAASLNAYKLIYMSNQGSVLSHKGNQKSNKKFYQEIPLSFAKSLTDYHKVKVHKTGFANFEFARQNLEPRAVELLLNLAWSSWALEQGVTRAHVVNPKDGALLEELFTSKNGANTCLYHDDENLVDDDDKDWMDDDDANDWKSFFAEAAAQEDSISENALN